MKSLVGRILAATAIALGSVVVLSPAAHAADGGVRAVKTNNVWTGPNARATCVAFGQAEIANGDWDGYRCLSDTTVAPDAIRFWGVIEL